MLEDFFFFLNVALYPQRKLTTPHCTCMTERACLRVLPPYPQETNVACSQRYLTQYLEVGAGVLCGLIQSQSRLASQ